MHNDAVADKPVRSRDRTSEVVLRMLQENTGSHICDSGGAYGRHWQRNAEKTRKHFEAEPKASIHFRVEKARDGRQTLDLWDRNVSLYHWMIDNLKYDQEIQGQFLDFSRGKDMYDLQAMEEFACEHYPGPNAEVSPINTYEYTDDFDLSQTLQWMPLHESKDEDYPFALLLQVHGGYDVRGGYTSPKAFKLKKDYWEMLDNTRVSSIYVDTGPVHHRWFRDGYLFRRDMAYTPDIEDVPAFDLDDVETPEILEIQQALTRHKGLRENLDSSTLSDDVKARAIAEADDVASSLESSIDDLRIKHLTEVHEDLDQRFFVVGTGGKAWMFDPSIHVGSKWRVENLLGCA